MLYISGIVRYNQTERVIKVADRIILHCDLNNFFASVSLLSNPTLYELPVAVCGSVEKRHGIVLAKNELAKKAGVKTAQAVWEAKAKCPDLVTIAPDYNKYNEYSHLARGIYERYTDLVEPFGIDECWLDVTGSTRLFGSGEQIAQCIRKAIKCELGITVSVGVSFNKIFAKLGSDMKKPDAVTVISRENFEQKVWPLPIGDLLFAGKSTVKKLNEAGIFTVKDITLASDGMLKRMLGVGGVQLKKYALGLDDSPVTPPSEDDMPKSIGRSVTPDHDITTPDEVWEILLALSEDISSELHKKKLYASGVCIHTRDTALKVKEISRSFNNPINTALNIAKFGMQIFEGSYLWTLPLRSVGIRVTGLKHGDIAVQDDVFGSGREYEQEEKIEDSVFSVRQKFGRDSLKRGTVYNKEKR